MESPNANSTMDLGPMQINTIHVPQFERMGVPRAALTRNACVNIAAGTMILARRLSETPNNPWRGVGNYHSKTPAYHRRYMRRIKKAYIRLLGTYAPYVAFLRRSTSARAALIQKQPDATDEKYASR